MKQKTIKEGYKFWSICCVQSGFCWKIIPAACVGNEEGRQIIKFMLSLIESLPLRDTKKYVCGLDNLFTWSRVLKGAHDMNVAIVGTARAKRGWPPKEIKHIKDDRFNTLYWQNDKDNYSIMR